MSYRDGNGGMPKDLQLAVFWLREAAEGGLANAQAELGSLYSKGACGLEKDTEEAAKWLRKAAEQGDVKAQACLGFLYWTGEVEIADSDTEAVRLFQAAAKQGHAKAQFGLGCCYMDGTGVEKDYQAACRWLALSCKEIPQAQIRLAMALTKLSPDQREKTDMDALTFLKF
jgi:TPR repeat protein